MPVTEETVERLRKAVRTKTAAEKRAEDARAALAIAMAAAIEEGMRQSEVVKLTGYTREHVRRLVRNAGLDAVMHHADGSVTIIEAKDYSDPDRPS